MMGSITMGFAFPAPSLKAALASSGGTHHSVVGFLLFIVGGRVGQVGIYLPQSALAKGHMCFVSNAEK